MRFAVLLLLAAALVLANARPDGSFNPIRLRSDRKVGAYVHNCLSWRLASEVNNFRNWRVVPAQCVEYVKTYTTAPLLDAFSETQYTADVELVVAEALDYLQTLTPGDKGQDTWLFDLSDTLLSTLPYYEQPDVNFGGNAFNRTKFNDWLKTGNMPAVPYIAELYYAAKAKGFKVVILSGTSNALRSVLEANLKKVGFEDWDKFILKNKTSTPTKDFKASERAQLKKDGYKVIGNVGDQWIDLLTGGNAGKRTFKIPNALYYVK